MKPLDYSSKMTCSITGAGPETLLLLRRLVYLPLSLLLLLFLFF